MSIKQIKAIEAMETVLGKKIIKTSLCEVNDNWLALANNGEDRLLVCVFQNESMFATMCKCQEIKDVNDVKVAVMELNANNAGAIRRFVRWTSPTACGNKGISIGFSDKLGSGGAKVAPLFSKRQLKPVLVEYTAADSVTLQRNLLEAMDVATWGVFADGFKEGYGANAANLTSEEEIVKALLYGYSMIGLDCSPKINLQIEKMNAQEVEKRYNDFPEEFRIAMQASYLNVEFKLSEDKLSFTPEVLQRIVLEYGEAIMHAQFIYNSYLKNTPWDIDFELNISKTGKILSPHEHYLIANELQRNKINFALLSFDALHETEALHDDLKLHAAIADTFGYRLGFANADLAIENLGMVAKALKGRAHFKLSNVLWLAALETLITADAELFASLQSYAKLPDPEGSILEPFSEIGKIYAASYELLLNPEQGNFAKKIKKSLVEADAVYSERISVLIGKYLRTL